MIMVNVSKILQILLYLFLYFLINLKNLLHILQILFGMMTKNLRLYVCLIELASVHIS